MTKSFNDFIVEGENMLTEDYREQCVEYKNDAIEQANRIIECFQEMINDGYYYHGAKHASRQLQDMADELENYKDRMDDQNNSDNAMAVNPHY